MKFDENIAAVHAYLCADGYVVKNSLTQKNKYYRAGLRNTSIILLEDFRDRFEKVFGIKPRLVPGERCEKGSKEIYNILTKNFGSFYSWEWSLPKIPKKYLKNWLRAYFDCEGWVVCNSHQNRCIGLECVNEKGIKQLQQALEVYGITSKVKKRGTRNIFSLQIYGEDNLIRFDKEIGFLHPSKKAKLAEVLLDFVDYNWKFPLNSQELDMFTLDVLKRKGKIKKDNGIVRLISNKESNLTRLKREINRLLNIHPHINKRINGAGTIYFELSINKKEDVKKLVENGFINDGEMEKWLKLKK